MGYFGRGKISTRFESINGENVLAFLEETIPLQKTLGEESDYLYGYYRGKQPILQRKKLVRPEIANMVVSNRASEIVDFKVGHLLSENVQYIQRLDGENGSKTSISEILRLNRYMTEAGKAPKDRELEEWSHICGTAYRIIIPKKQHFGTMVPFEIFTMDSRASYMAYNMELEESPVAFVKYVDVKDEAKIEKRMYSIWTDEYSFIVEGTPHGGIGKIVNSQYSPYGIPAVEYPMNNTRIGCFEKVLPLLDAYNTILSNSVDDIEQVVQSFMRVHNAAIDEETWQTFLNNHMIAYNDIDPSKPASIDYINCPVNQSGVQGLAKYIYDDILTICAMPNRNGGSSTSDTGRATFLRDGWSAANAAAVNTELMFKQSERQFLEKVLDICNTVMPKTPFNITSGDIDIKFTRRNYENIAEKVSVYSALIASGYIDPKDAAETCNLFSDPELVYRRGMAFHDSLVEKEMDELKAAAEADTAAAKRKAVEADNADDGGTKNTEESANESEGS